MTECIHSALDYLTPPEIETAALGQPLSLMNGPHNVQFFSVGVHLLRMAQRPKLSTWLSQVNQVVAPLDLKTVLNRWLFKWLLSWTLNIKWRKPTGH